MRRMGAFFRKEMMELLRRKKLMIVGILFLLFGILGPATAKLTPEIIKMLGDSSVSGLTITAEDVTVMDSWIQFFKNLDIPMIVIIIMWSSAFTTEYRQGTLIPLVTKGLSRTEIYAAKMLMLHLVWTLGYLMYFGVVYGYNSYYWGNDGVKHMFVAILLNWLYGAFMMSLVGLFSAIAESGAQVMLGVGAVWFLCTLVGIAPKLADKLPTMLTDGMSLMRGVKSPGDYTIAVVITAVLTLTATFGGAVLMQRKKL